MNFDWRPTATGTECNALWVTFEESHTTLVRRCGEIHQRRPRGDWTYVLSLSIAPPDFVVDPVPRFATEQEAKDALQNISTVLLIGGHHERK
jgi:hypothetical protein